MSMPDFILITMNDMLYEVATNWDVLNKMRCSRLDALTGTCKMLRTTVSGMIVKCDALYEAS